MKHQIDLADENYEPLFDQVTKVILLFSRDSFANEFF